MDPTGVTSGAKSAISALKDAYAVGQEGGKFISDVQQDNARIVAQQQKLRGIERNKKEQLGSYQEQKAYKKFLADRETARVSAELKAEILKKYGQKGWEDFLKAKAEVKKIDTEEEKHVSADTDKINNLFWYCMIVALIIVYFIFTQSN
jgi:hypothetical protein